jgi:hypothetical protein
MTVTRIFVGSPVFVVQPVVLLRFSIKPEFSSDLIRFGWEMNSEDGVCTGFITMGSDVAEDIAHPL